MKRLSHLSLLPQLPLAFFALSASTASAETAASGHGGDLLAGIGLSIIAATVLALAARAARQPLLLAYLIAGVILGPEMGFGLISDPATIELISEVGLILLLFIIGLEIDLKKLRLAGRAVLITGVAQFLGCVALGLIFFQFVAVGGSGRFDSFYLAVSLALSSTMIVVKLLYDKHGIGTLPGQLTLGILVFQDLWAIVVLAVLPNLESPGVAAVGSSFLAGALLVIASLACSRFVLPALFAWVAKLPEVMLIAALAWCFLVSGAAGAAGLSAEMGALVAGVSISTFPYNVDVVSKVTSIRDFFVTLFFVSLGMTIPFPTWSMLGMATLLSGFLLASRFLTIFPILYACGNGLRASLLPCLNLAQMSEFSLVIVNLGVGFGHIGGDVVGVLTMVFALTAVGSTYMITYSHPIQHQLSRLLRSIGLRDPARVELDGSADGDGPAVVLLGFFREASSILHELCFSAEPRLRPDQVLVVDFNPDVHRELNRRGVRCVYGDVSSMETLHHAHIAGAQLVVCTLADTILRGTDNRRMLRQTRRIAPQAQIIVTAETIRGALDFYDDGADFVFLPRLYAAPFVAATIVEALDGGLAAVREAERENLRTRSEVLP